MNTRFLHIAAFVLGLVMLIAPVRARQDAPTGFSSGGEVGLRISNVGLGNRARAGDWTAIQVDVLHRSSNPKPMAVIVRLDIPNDDGDRGMHQRVVVTNPNRPVTTWLYARLPFNYRPGSDISVSAFVPFDQEAGADTLSEYDPTKPVGIATQRLTGLVSDYSGMIAVVGRSSAGLDRYAQRVGITGDVPLTGHELTEVASGLTAAGLPDRVHGLRAYEAIVWTGESMDEQPARLNVAQADAIREWVASGGHLVIVLPLVGQTWLDTPNPLSDIMPKVHPNRKEGVSLADMRYVLATTRAAVLPERTIMHTFAADASAGAFDAISVLTTKQGEPLVVRRQVGIGAVTIIGLDVPSLARDADFRTDAFWNRVLGKRLSLPTRKEVDELMVRGLITPQNRPDAWFERSIAGQVNRDATAAAGLLAAVIVFGSFWLIAGPVGFFLLKKKNKVQHSWLAYAGVIALFTGIAWTAATMMRTRRAEASHVTVLDHVYGQPCQRARMWANVFLPSYGSTNISLAIKPFDLAGRALEPHPALAAWEAPGPGNPSEFPETRGYVVDTRALQSVDFPARSTTRQIQVDWLGSPQLNMPLPTSATGQSVEMGEEIQFLLEKPQGQANRWTVTGSLTHNMPAELRDVVIIVNRGNRRITPVVDGSLLADAGVFKLTNPWKPGEPLPLSTATQHGNEATYQAADYLSQLSPRATNQFFNAHLPTTSQEDIRQAKSEIVANLTALSLYSMLTPPDPRSQNDSRVAARRQTTHTLDLGRWFTQPCVIVIGFLHGETPVPMTVDGETAPSHGITAVRWIYPLKNSLPTEYADIAPIDSGNGAAGEASTEQK